MSTISAQNLIDALTDPTLKYPVDSARWSRTSYNGVQYHHSDTAQPWTYEIQGDPVEEVRLLFPMGQNDEELISRACALNVIVDPPSGALYEKQMEGIAQRIRDALEWGVRNGSDLLCFSILRCNKPGESKIKVETFPPGPDPGKIALRCYWRPRSQGVPRGIRAL